MLDVEEALGHIRDQHGGHHGRKEVPAQDLGGVRLKGPAPLPSAPGEIKVSQVSLSNKGRERRGPQTSSGNAADAEDMVGELGICVLKCAENTCRPAGRANATPFGRDDEHRIAGRARPESDRDVIRASGQCAPKGRGGARRPPWARWSKSSGPTHRLKGPVRNSAATTMRRAIETP